MAPVLFSTLALSLSIYQRFAAMLQFCLPCDSGDRSVLSPRSLLTILHSTTYPLPFSVLFTLAYTGMHTPFFTLVPGSVGWQRQATSPCSSILPLLLLPSKQAPMVFMYYVSPLALVVVPQRASLTSCAAFFSSVVAWTLPLKPLPLTLVQRKCISTRDTHAHCLVATAVTMSQPKPVHKHKCRKEKATGHD